MPKKDKKDKDAEKEKGKGKEKGKRKGKGKGKGSSSSDDDYSGEICTPCGTRQLYDTSSTMSFDMEEGKNGEWVMKKSKKTKKDESEMSDFEKQRARERAERMKRHKERLETLARPNQRLLQSLYEERFKKFKCCEREKLKSGLEDQFCLGPEATEHYFKMLASGGADEAGGKHGAGGAGGGYAGRGYGGGAGGGAGGTKRYWSPPGNMMERQGQQDNNRMMLQRQKWLVDFSAQVAYHMCDYLAKNHNEILVSNRLRSIADVVLERIAEILGEPKPSRSSNNRMARFMVSISDRIAVWIENAVYRADAYETCGDPGRDDHIAMDNLKAI